MSTQSASIGSSARRVTDRFPPTILQEHPQATVLPIWIGALLICVLAVLTPACSSDFPNEPVRGVTLEASEWPSELAVTDVDTIEIQVRLRDSPENITGLRVRWKSSDDQVLRVVQLQPPAGASLEDSLLTQRRAEITALSGGSDTVSVLVEAGGAFEAAESTFVVRVTQKWVTVSAGKTHTCGITIDSLAYCWGEDSDGKLGRGRPVGSAIPIRVVATDNLRFSTVTAGDESSCGITTLGLAYCWGLGSEGRLGNGDPSERSRLIPAPVSGPAFQALHTGRIGCGITDDFRAECWGSNGEGQLGVSPFAIPGLSPCLEGIPCSLVPIPVDTTGPRPESYGSVSIGNHHTCGLSHAPQDGVAFCWGIGVRGELGNATDPISPIPIQVTSDQTFTAISAGGEHTCALTDSKQTYCWGANTNGQLGNGTTDDLMIPALTAQPFESVTTGRHHTCALTTAGEAFCWGLGSSGQLGNGSVAQQSMPFRVSDVPRFESVSAGDLHTCGVAVGGALYCWGEGTAGRLGTGSTANQPTPTRVSEPD